MLGKAIGFNLIVKVLFGYVIEIQSRLQLDVCRDFLKLCISNWVVKAFFK